MTNDSKLFPPLEKWEVEGYKPDVFGRWIGPEGNVALPLYQGAMINLFDFSQKAWISGLGRSAIWQDVFFDNKELHPKMLMGEAMCRTSSRYAPGLKIGQRNIARSTDTRTLITCLLSAFPCGHKLPCLKVTNSFERTIRLAVLLSSLVVDSVARVKVAGTSVDLYHISDLPIPTPSDDQNIWVRPVLSTACLTFLHRRFAPEWLRLKFLYPQLAQKEWKHWWAVTEADRLRLRVEIDALCADLYGLEPDDFDWIVRDDPTDPKGFYRVDRKLPFRERLTGLAAAAFRALKDGKWSTESAVKLSNDEFFEIIGIPEMTTGPDPLIRKRTGCHVWRPEAFGKDDSRYGWTWDHCWQDAVALLGSDEAVRKYIKGKSEEPEAPSEDDPSSDGPKDLFGNRVPTDLFGAELRTKPRKKK